MYFIPITPEELNETLFTPSQLADLERIKTLSRRFTCWFYIDKDTGSADGNTCFYGKKEALAKWKEGHKVYIVKKRRKDKNIYF